MNDKYISPYPLPTDYQRELLIILIEEAGEVIQRATKLLRFGADEVQPGQELTNRQRLGHEVGDLKKMVDICAFAGMIDAGDIQKGFTRKMDQLTKFLQTTPHATGGR